MYRDISNIKDNICTAIIDDKTLLTYTGTDYVTYRLMGNKYYSSYSDTANNAPNINTTCYTTQQLETLPSPYDFMTPIYHSMAITTALIIFFVAYRFIIYPFWRTK